MKLLIQAYELTVIVVLRDKEACIESEGSFLTIDCQSVFDAWGFEVFALLIEANFLYFDTKLAHAIFKVSLKESCIDLQLFAVVLEQWGVESLRKGTVCGLNLCGIHLLYFGVFLKCY